MNTFFFLRVRLRRSLGRRSFVYGPYSSIEHAESMIDWIPGLLKEFQAEASTYNLYIEEKCAQDGAWIKVNTRTKIVVDGTILSIESERVSIHADEMELDDE
jgi:hypothetical protein